METKGSAALLGVNFVCASLRGLKRRENTTGVSISRAHKQLEPTETARRWNIARRRRINSSASGVSPPFRWLKYFNLAAQKKKNTMKGWKSIVCAGFAFPDANNLFVLRHYVLLLFHLRSSKISVIHFWQIQLKNYDSRVSWKHRNKSF